MGKIIWLILLTQICSNSWWFCATQQESIGGTPMIGVAVISSVGLVIWCCSFIYDTWD